MSQRSMNCEGRVKPVSTCKFGCGVRDVLAVKGRFQLIPFRCLSKAAKGRPKQTMRRSRVRLSKLLIDPTLLLSQLHAWVS